MKEIKNDPNLLSNLMQLAMSDPESSVRQMAAVILRKDLSRKYTQERVTFLWMTFLHLSENRGVQINHKVGVLQTYFPERNFKLFFVVIFIIFLSLTA